MVTWLFLILFLLTILLLAFYLRLISNLLTCTYRRVVGYVQDLRVDAIIYKASYLGELSSYGKVCSEKERVDNAVTKACSIASDVLRQNGIDPRDYNLISLVALSRVLLNFDIPKDSDLPKER